MKGVRLSLAAEGDLQAIDDYTIAHFGLRQAIKTAAALEAAMVSLARNPRSARLASDLCPPGRLFRFRVVLSAFVIVYETWDRGIRVARVLHGARYLPAELEREPGDDP